MEKLIKEIRNLNLLVIALMIIIFLVFMTRVIDVDHNKLQDLYNMTNVVVPALTVFFVYKTFQNQQEQLSTLRLQINKNDHAEKINQVEKRFFFFLQLHRDNVSSMSFQSQIIGKRLFIKVIEKFERNYPRLQQILTENHNDTVHKFNEKELIEINYKLIFYGFMNRQSADILKDSLQRYDRFMKNGTFSQFIIEKLQSAGIKETGLQSNLGHYFRHFFHTVTYIHDIDKTLLSDDDKYFYLKRLRGQLTNQEIALLFINSFSIGRRWVHYDRIDEFTNDGVNLIEHYDLIKNLPEGFLKFDVKKYFPKTEFESRILADSPLN